ncbi:hypothetical protein HCG51_26225 [Tolypothrix sp. PCC 7910]|uniref:hypothetical protein n=1 Tax=Tolypothrix sp. PCC 7910 TaxID=2099387 RepID=UPI0014279529|nr:hypothetical protein [Tolypothrix sp. PCC 7910]QIR39859.1 hypothetical protein HCG51_26225 [Tolypothrix sp. PCC 7910]
MGEALLSQSKLSDRLCISLVREKRSLDIAAEKSCFTVLPDPEYTMITEAL